MTPAQRKRMLEQRSQDKQEKKMEPQVQKEQKEQENKLNEHARKLPVYKTKCLPCYAFPRIMRSGSDGFNKKINIPTYLLNIANDQCVPIYNIDNAGYPSVHVLRISKIMDLGQFINYGEVDDYPYKPFWGITRADYHRQDEINTSMQCMDHIEDFDKVKDLMKYCQDTFDQKYKSLMVVRVDYISPINPSDYIIDLEMIKQGHVLVIFRNYYSLEISFCRIDHPILECYCERKYPNMMATADIKDNLLKELEDKKYGIIDIMKQILRIMESFVKMQIIIKKICDFGKNRHPELFLRAQSKKYKSKVSKRKKDKKLCDQDKYNVKLKIPEIIDLFVDCLNEMSVQCTEIMRIKTDYLSTDKSKRIPYIKKQYCEFMSTALERLDRLHDLRGFHHMFAPIEFYELENTTEEEWLEFIQKEAKINWKISFDGVPQDAFGVEQELKCCEPIMALMFPPNLRAIELDRMLRLRLLEQVLIGETKAEEYVLFVEFFREDLQFLETLVNGLSATLSANPDDSKSSKSNTSNAKNQPKAESFHETNRRFERDLEKLPTLVIPDELLHSCKHATTKPVTKSDKKRCDKTLSDNLPVLLDEAKRVPDIPNVEEYLHPKSDEVDNKGAKPKTDVNDKNSLKRSKFIIKSMLQHETQTLPSEKTCTIVDAVPKSKSAKKSGKPVDNPPITSSAISSKASIKHQEDLVISTMPKFKLTKVEGKSAAKAVCGGDVIKKANARDLKLTSKATEPKSNPKLNDPESAEKTKSVPKPQPKLSDFVDLSTLKPELSTIEETLLTKSKVERNINILSKGIEISEEFPRNKIKTEDEEEKEIMRKTKENINRKTKPIMKYVEQDNDVLDINKSEDLNNWEDLFDDDGRLAESLFSEISNKFDDQYEPTIVKAAEDYSAYTTKQKSFDEMNHIVEAYDFPAPLCTNDILQAFSHLNSDTMYVKWVDDTHALLVFESFEQAFLALNDSPLIKTRPMIEASPQSIAVVNNNDLKPAMRRPQTDVQTARRMIASHLRAAGKLASEIKATTKSISKNTKPLQGKEIEQFEHVLELYDISNTFSTADIMQTFSYMSSESMYVKWVDTNRALLVLGSSIQAKRVLENPSPLIKARPMTEASPFALALARETDLKPAMKRPQTNLQTARRLITSHLGATSRVTREQSARERSDLRAAREMKKKAKQQERDAWDGNFPSTSNH